MVKHIILWKLKENISDKEKVKRNIKTELEKLINEIDGINKMVVIIDGLESSTCDAMLDSEFINYEALKNYKIHPAHQNTANTFVRPNVELRLCMDYEIK